MDQAKIGRFIAKLRKENDLTQEQLAEKLNVTNKSVSKWETGICLPDIETLILLAELFEIELTDLIKGERIKTPKIESERMITISEATALTANSIKVYKEIEKRKSNKKIKWLVVIIVLLITLISGIYLINNYNKCQVYSIESAYGEVTLSGALVVTNDKSFITINDVLYNGNKLKDIYAIEYRLTVDGKELYKFGDISTYNLTRQRDEINIKEYFRQMNIYGDKLSNEKVNRIINSNDMAINIKYMDKQGIENNYDIPLKLKKEYSNSKLLYRK